jgi:hypothetical protein
MAEFGVFADERSISQSFLTWKETEDVVSPVSLPRAVLLSSSQLKLISEQHPFPCRGGFNELGECFLFRFLYLYQVIFLFECIAENLRVGWGTGWPWKENLLGLPFSLYSLVSLLPSCPSIWEIVTCLTCNNLVFFNFSDS